MKLKYVLLILVVAVSGFLVSTFSWFTSCQGRMQQCYAAFRGFTSNVDRIAQERQRSIHGGFTASQSTVAFQIPLGDGTDGIILIARSTNQSRLISFKNYTHWSPRFSPDGERLVFLRQVAGSRERELLTCEVRTWQCSILFRTTTALSSAIDAGNGDVIFAMNALRENDNENSRRFDIFAVRKGQKPTRLTNYEMYELSSISVGGDRIAFGADGKRGFEQIPCADRDIFKCDKSHIYVLEFDPAETTIPNKPTALKPRFTVAGYSVSPILSGDGKRVAFLNTNRKGNPWRYNIAVADIDGVVDGGFAVEGSAFSSGAFVGNTLLVNELFDDHYRVLTADLGSRQVMGLQVKHSPEYLKTVEPINLSVDDLANVL